MIINTKIKSLLKFTNLLVKKGKKNKAAYFFNKTLYLLKKKTKKNPMNLMYSAIKTLTPGVSTRKTVVAGRLYHLPCAISSNKALYFGCNWLQESAITTKEGNKKLSLSDKLFSECIKVLNKKGNAILFLKQHNKSVSDNRPFLRFVKRKRSLRLPRKIFLRKRKILYLKRRKKNIIPDQDTDDYYDFDLNSDAKPKIQLFYDTKLEEKFQSKTNTKFIKIDKKRDFVDSISLNKKTDNDPKKKYKRKKKHKNKTINK